VGYRKKRIRTSTKHHLIERFTTAFEIIILQPTDKKR
jgi:hypothetical protein